MIEVRDLSKWFRGAGGERVMAADAVRFTVRPGEVFGLLGPNGAGKTTTLRMLCTVLTPSAGTASIAGFDVVEQPGEVRRHVGFLSANTGVYERMTAWEMVEYYGKLNQIAPEVLKPRMEELFETLQMQSFRDTRGGQMSTGMKQKLSIARALVNDPPVLIFDEPTSGLDVLVQRAVLNNIKALRGRGKTIIFSTHIMREVEKLCDRVAIMAKGKVVVCGTPDELRELYKQDDLEELFFSLVS
jgi:sodium transport system ATP-binding protein